MHPAPEPVPAEAIVLIVSADSRERERLRSFLPPEVAVVLAASEDEAAGTLRSAALSGAALGAGVCLLPDAVLIAGRHVRLTPLEHALLRCLLSPAGSVWSFLALSEQVWGTSFVGDGSQVRAVVKRLRRKLLDAGAPVHIEAVRGRGLRLVDGARAPSGLRGNCPTTAPVAP